MLVTKIADKRKKTTDFKILKDAAFFLKCAAWPEMLPFALAT